MGNKIAYLRPFEYDIDGIYFKKPIYGDSINYHKNQLFFPKHSLADGLGYIHFKSKAALERFIQNNEKKL